MQVRPRTTSQPCAPSAAPLSASAWCVHDRMCTATLDVGSSLRLYSCAKYTYVAAAGANACHHQPHLACAPRLRHTTTASAAAVAAPAADFVTHDATLRSDATASVQHAVLGHLQRWVAVEADDEQLSYQHVSVMDTLCMLSYDDEQEEEPAVVHAAMQRTEDFISAMDTLCLLSYDDE